MLDPRRDADDQELLQKAAYGSAAAFNQLVDRHAQRLYRLAVSMVHNAADADDVLQETFAGAFGSMRNFEGRASVKTWLTRILMLQAARFLRDSKRHPTESLEKVEMSGGFASAKSSAGVEERMDLQAALAKLSPDHRQVLVLREYEQLSYEEIAAVLDVPRGTVESRLHRARGELREILKAYGA